MTESRARKRYDFFVLVLFVVMFLIIVAILFTGLAWVTVETAEFNFWLSVVTTIWATVSGIVATYSFVQYTQERFFRSFIICLLGANVVLLAFLILVTHPVATWSAFADRIRNRTIVTALGFLLAPGLLAGSIAGERQVTTKMRNITILWGILAQPAFALWLFFVPVPPFELTRPPWGLAGITPVGWAVFIVVSITAFVSFFRYMSEWLRTKDRIVLALTLALVSWITSVFVFAILDDPLQVAELIWIAGMAVGFTLLAAAMILTSIIEPHRALETVVSERTFQLQESREETEFYLSLWTHKMGNLLHAIATYLELIEEGIKVGGDLSSLQKPTEDLIQEAIRVNRQVAKLTKIKERADAITWPVNLDQALLKSVREAESSLQRDVVFAISAKEGSIQVYADDMIDIVLVNMVTRCGQQVKGPSPMVNVSMKKVSGDTELTFEYEGPGITSEMIEWLTVRPPLRRSILDLDLFMSILLMERYGGRIRYEEIKGSDKKRIALTFRSA
ncbi:MAG: HAMP domain-containing histidine kinase [Candidatus Thorarchaeota archaeon]|nr:MAG: HAMP domain-containing histidine kinase [Candidatus Thorarchaeota archaeon]